MPKASRDSSLGTFGNENTADMMTLRDYLRIAGVIVFSLGFLCLPIGYSASPKRDLSLFLNFADMGFFLSIALALIPAGILTFAASYIPLKKNQKRARRL
jgi:hypothetical protein